MSNVTFNSASARFTASYAGYMKKTEPVKMTFTQEQLDNMVPLELKRLSHEEYLQEMQKGWKTTETTAEDGTVTRTISGTARLYGCNGFHYEGTADFSVSVTFDPSTYEMGQLGDSIDLMAAAFEARKQAIQACFSGAELAEQTNQLTVQYQEQKHEVATSFSNMVGGVLEERGQAGQTQKIYDSVQALFLSFEAKYHSLAVSSPKGWMKAGLYEATINLQRLGASIQPDSSKQNGLYTLRELELTAAGVHRSLNIHA